MSNRLRELRLVAPIVIAVCTILLTAIYLETHFERLVSRRNSDPWEDWLLWSQFCIMSTSAAGIWMAAVWSSLYGKKTLVRLAAAVFVIFGAAALGWQSYKSLGSWAHPRPYEVLGALLGGAIGFFVICALPLLAMRWLRAWRILHEDEVSACRTAGRYSLKGIFFFTTAVAVFLTVLIWVVEILRVGDRGKEFVYFSFNILPSMGGLMLLMAMSRMRIRWIWPTACMLGLCIAGAIAFGLSLNSDRQLGWQRIIEEIFLPTLIGFIYAACLTLLAALWLRSRGFLIRSGGSRGFGAIRDATRPFPRRAIAMALTCVLLVGLGFGGWEYYSHWVLMKSAIPAEPTVEDLPRLMRLACYIAPDHKSSDTRKKAWERRQQASDTIISMGDQAVPFLLERLTELVDDEQNRVPSTAGELLSSIGAQLGFGSYEDRVLATITENEQAATYGSLALISLGADAVPAIIEVLENHDDRTNRSAFLLARIGLPDAAPAIPALKRACLTKYAHDRGFWSPSHLYHALTELAAADAIPTLLEVLKDRKDQSLKRRVYAASAIAKLGTEGAVAVPMIDNLLGEVDAVMKQTAPATREAMPNHKIASQYYESQNLQVQLLESVAAIGPRAKSLAPRLLQILESSEADSSVRTSLVELMGRLQVVEAIPILEEIVKDETSSSEVQTAAITALGEIGPPAKEAIESIEIYLSKAEGYGFGLHPRVIVAEVARARILMAQRESLTFSHFATISQLSDTEATAEAFRYDTSQELAALCALIWLGSEGNEEVMQHQAAISLNGDSQKARAHFRDDPVLESMPMSQRLEDVLCGRHNEPASFDSRWNRDGKVRSLQNSLEIGLQAEEAASRVAAANLVAAMGSLSLPLAPVLNSCLDDEDPRVRVRTAVALLLAGEASEEVFEVLHDTEDSDWAWVPDARHLIEARIDQHFSH